MMPAASNVNLRPALASHLDQRLHAFRDGFRRNLAVIGSPGSGKTFQLQQAFSAHPDLLFVYCPVYRESCRTFLHRLLGAVLEAGLHELNNLPTEALMQRAEQVLPRTAEGLRHVEGLMARRAFAESFIRLLDVIPIMTQERGRSGVLVLEEFLFLEEMGLTHAFDELGKRVMTWPGILFILSSSSPYRTRVILRERFQLLFGQFELLSLDSPDGAQAQRWVEEELLGLRYPDALRAFLISWLGAYPWYLSVFLKRLRELAALQHAGDIGEALFLQTAWELLGSPEGTLHQWCVSHTEPLLHSRHGRRAMEVLVQIADGARTMTEIARRIGRSGVSAALPLLAERDLAQRNGICWMTPDPALRCWLSIVLWTQQSDQRMDPCLVRQRFEQHLKTLWDGWRHQQECTFPDRVAGLLAQFSDETISLDQKTGRLPRFQRIQTLPQGASTYLVAESGGKRWCCSVEEKPVTEQDIASFEAFCRRQAPRPSRKVIVARRGLEENAKLLAKAVNMWVWGPEELQVLTGLYGQPPAPASLQAAGLQTNG